MDYFKDAEGNAMNEEGLRRKYGELIVSGHINPATKGYKEFKQSILENNSSEKICFIGKNHLDKFTFKLHVKEFAVFDVFAPNADLAQEEAERIVNDGEVDLEWEDDELIKVCENCHRQLENDGAMVERKCYCDACAELARRHVH